MATICPITKDKSREKPLVLDESLSNLIVSFLQSYVESYTEELKAIKRLQAKARKG